MLIFQQGAMMNIRPFTAADHDACMALFVDLIPVFFIKEEIPQFDTWLRSMPSRYYVVTNGGQVLGCGGIALKKDGTTAILCWGLISKDHHRRGIGSLLLNHRIEQIAQAYPQTKQVYLETSHVVQPFYQKHGFEVLQIIQNKIAQGLHQVDMVRKINYQKNRKPPFKPAKSKVSP